MKVEITWQARETPLGAEAVLIPKSKNQQIIDKLLHFEEERLKSIKGLISSEGVLLVASEKNLPWIDGCIYLGQDTNAPHLYMDTRLRPSLPCALLDNLIYRNFRKLVAFAPNNNLIPMDNLKTVSRERLLELQL